MQCTRAKSRMHLCFSLLVFFYTELHHGYLYHTVVNMLLFDAFYIILVLIVLLFLVKCFAVSS